MGKWIKGIWIILALWASESAFACSVCATGKEEARYAYYGTTVLLSLLPLLMVGGVVYYIVKRSR